MPEDMAYALIRLADHNDGHRVSVQIAGGHPFKPPSQDVNAPDLYIPLMALCTYCILGSITMVSKGRWTTDSMYALVSLHYTTEQ